MKTILTDIADNQGNTYEGLHVASTGGSWQSAVMGFGGISVDKELHLNINPWIPKSWRSMGFSINWQGCRLSINISNNEVVINSTGTLKVKVYGSDYLLHENGEVRVKR